MFRKLLNRKNIVIGMFFVLIIFVFILATYLIIINTEQSECEEIKNEYQSRLDLAQDQYDSETADMQKQYETEIADIRSVTQAEMCSQYSIHFCEKYKPLGEGSEVMGTYPYVEGMTDDVLEDTINENLKKAFLLDWLSKKIQYCDCAFVTVEYNSNDLLSVSVCYKNLFDFFTWFEIYHTIDMRTGDILYLNDIVEVDEEFVDLLFTEGIIHPANYPCPTDVSSYDKGEILERLQICSETYDDYHYRKPTFYLGNQRLYFTAIFSDIDIFYVELDDIEDKLKIEKW